MTEEESKKLNIAINALIELLHKLNRDFPNNDFWLLENALQDALDNVQ